MTGRRRIRVCVRGVVQGVGLPAVRLHTRGGASGCPGRCATTPSGAVIEVEGDAADIGDFLARLRDQPPPLAVIESD